LVLVALGWFLVDLDGYAALPLPVRKASGFPFASLERRGFASGGLAATRVAGLAESLRLSARDAAKPQDHLAEKISSHLIK